MNRIFILLASLCSLTLSAVAAPTPLELKEGDRVVFIGDTLIEREQNHGWIELMLTTRFPDRHVTFRNLGWSADLPDGESRLGLSLGQAGNEPAGEGWKLLQKQIGEARPTVAFIGYGMAASFDGAPGLPKFKADYERLLDTIEKLSPGCRLVLLGPLNHGAGNFFELPKSEREKRSGQTALYGKAIEGIAATRNVKFVSLSSEKGLGVAAAGGQAGRSGTDNGIHPDGMGYMVLAGDLERELFGKSRSWLVTTFSEPLEPLRQVILRKNEFFFHRSRPANMAYIFGFRRGEQGRNAVEMPKFDPFIAAEEKKIRELCKHLNDPNFKPGPDLQPAALLGKAAAARHTPQPTPQFTVAEGLEITLWAENPHLAKPIQINFDAQGRLWVASSEVYPQIEPGQAAHDKIVVLEDTKGAGKADKATVFADNMLIPTGLAPGDGGVYVAQSTELLHLKDTNGDGKADVRRVVLSSFGTEDTHHNLHTLRWGPDGRLWMSQSIYIRSEVETPHGVVRLRSGGVFRFEPAAQKLEVVFKGWVNSWGHQFDEFGQSFMTDGAGGAGINWGLPGGMYVTYARARRILPSVSPGGYPKFASLEIIHSEHFPAHWQGRMVTCDFRANRVTSFSITEQGAGYVTKQEADICRTPNNTFRPIDVKLGPDGALYIADWSNPIINHGEVDFRDPRRDREHGRIWRVAVKGKAGLKNPSLAKASTSALLNELLSPNHFNSSQATRLLVEKGAANVAPGLKPWTAQLKTEKEQLAALWIHQSLNVPAPDLLAKLLAAQDGRIRAAAVRALGFATIGPAKPVRLVDANGTASTYLTDAGASFSESDTVAHLARLVADPHPRVRVEAVRALAKFPSARSAELVLSAMDGIGSAPFLDYAVWLSINELAQPFLAALESGAWVPNSPAKQTQLEYALKALDPALAASSVAKLLAAKPLTKDGSGPWIELIGAAGGSAEINRLWEQVVKRDFTDAALHRALNVLSRAARLRNVKPAGDASPGLALLSDANPATRVAFVNLLGAWKNPGPAFAEMVKLAGTENTPAEVRTALFGAFREMGAIPPVLAALQPLAAKASPAPVRRAAAVTLASLQPANFADLALDELAETKTDAEALDLWRSVLATKGAARQFGDKVGSRTALPAHVASSGLRAAREAAQPDATLVASLTRLANITALSPDKLTPAKLKELADLAVKSGDPARGERVYRRAELGCVLCHSIGGVGGKVGPDMTSLGTAAPADYLVESLLLPNAKIKEGFHGINIETKDDLEYSGILVRETGQEVIVRNSQNQEVSVAKSNLRKRSNAAQSLMPTGLLDSVSDSDRNDLVAFLTRLGKAGDYDASKGGVARLWQFAAAAPADVKNDEAAWRSGKFPAKKTTPLISLVDGRLVADDLKATLTQTGSKERGVSVFVAAQFQSPKEGTGAFKIEGASKAGVFLDGKAVKVADDGSFSAGLAAGPHTLVLRLDPLALPESVRVKSGDVNFAVGL